MRIILVIIFLLLTNIAIGQNKKPVVVSIYPTTDSVPVNILRFYIEFSQPMQEMNILEHITLTTEAGKNITGVFFENQYELWNEDRTKVTLIVDPGRVKLGLLANNQMGRAFDEGINYTLTVDSLLLNFKDKTLARSYAKTFVAIAEDIIPPNVALWKHNTPKIKSKEALVIHFKDKIDHISAQTLVKIFRDGQPITGKIILEDDEQNWSFIPSKKWKKGNYQIIANHRLEDIASNSMNQVFDHKQTDFNPNIKENYVLTFKLIALFQ